MLGDRGFFYLYVLIVIVLYLFEVVVLIMRYVNKYRFSKMKFSFTLMFIRKECIFYVFIKYSINFIIIIYK